MLDQPQLPRQELIGLAGTFGFYQTLPKSKWKWIKEAEVDTKKAKKLRSKLLKDYHETTSSPKSSKPELLAPDTIDA